jgi:hypothetical protein
MEPSYEGEDVDGTVASDVWSFFDDLLDIKGASWQGLREVARSHGINAIRRAIENRTLSDSCIDRLIRICRDSSAWREVEILVSAWLDTGEVMSLTKTSLLDADAWWRGAEEVRFRALMRFASQDESRILALSTTSKHPWNTLLRAITQGAQDGALQFLQVCVESHHTAGEACAAEKAAADAHHKQLTQNLNEVASKLCIMACTSLLLDENSPHGMALREGLRRARGWW